MSNENIIILKMLDQGKINVNDAVKLLNIINSINLTESKDSSIEQNINKFSTILDALAKDIKCKIQKENPKFKESTHSIISKTGELFSDFGKNIKDIFSIEDSNSSNLIESYDVIFDVSEEKENN